MKALWIGIWLFLLSLAPSFAGEELVNTYRVNVPITFGMWVDLHFRLFSLQHSSSVHKVKMYLGKSGGVQLQVRYDRSRLPRKKTDAEQFIEDKSLKVKREADQLVRSLWSLFPRDIPEHIFAEQNDIVNAFVFLNEEQIGFADGETFYWRRKEVPDKVLTNKW
ncbi:hypothetical protein HOF92_03385 [bacterium]|nr:hypothetical protein [bacterium]